MSRFSPVTAATEGFRVMRREPLAVIAWTLLWVVTFSVVSFAKLATGGVPNVLAPHRSNAEIIKSFGPLAIVLVPALLALWVVTIAAGFRAVLRPEERSWFFIRLGMDEFRLALMTAAVCILIVIFGGLPASVMFFLFTPIFTAIPAFTRDIAFVGALLSVCLEVWIGVRLSLIAVETFAERRFHLSAYWPLVRGRFWRLLCAYVIVAVAVCSLLVVALAAVVSVTAISQSIGMPDGADIARRAALLLAAGVLATILAAAMVLPLVLIGACQAYCFRALADDSPTVYGMSWAPDPDAHHAA